MKRNHGFIQEQLIPSMVELRGRALGVEADLSREIGRVHLGYRDSARNLAHYLALRRTDVRDLQDELTYLGLSSMGRSESCVMSTLENIIGTLYRLEGMDAVSVPGTETTVDARTGPMYLTDHAQTLLGPPGDHRASRIMVTMPSEAADDGGVIYDLVDAGMDIMRINCAHDDADAWLRMVQHLRTAERRLQRTCKVYVDLAGPKLRTGPMEQIRVHNGDRLRIQRDPTLPSVIPVVSCTLDAVFDGIAVDESIWFDDGKIGGIVRSVDDGGFEVEINRVRTDGAWLREEKGINVPETRLVTEALTKADLENLAVMGRHADIIGMSFVRSADDVAQLFDQIRSHQLHGRGVVVKIENRDAFEHLPRILLEGLTSPPFGVMVARGDLAVEVGFERLAEVQEEILWLCEAAHIPVIWATQVLEGMAKKGRPTRAEVSDAAMSVRAECVMLNKGPYIVDTVRFLSDILRRMAAHQSKKRALLRRLEVSDAVS
jgi:pyruvate kinase